MTLSRTGNLLYKFACSVAIVACELREVTPPAECAAEWPGLRSRELVETCGAAAENPEVKVVDADYFRSRPDELHHVLLALSTPGAGECPGEGVMPASEQTLGCLSKINQQQVSCLLELTQRQELAVTWFDDPAATIEGNVFPIARVISANLDWETILEVARLRDVARIELAPLQEHATTSVPPAPCSCPDPAAEASLAQAKLTGAVPAANSRVPFVISIRDQGPAAPTSSEADAVRNWWWQRTAMNQRGVHCILRAVDSIASQSGPLLPYGSGETDLSVTPLPPLSTVASTRQSIALNLTLAEAQELTQHPFVDTIRFDPDIAGAIDNPCPQSTAEPMSPECSIAHDSEEVASRKVASELLQLPSDQLVNVVVLVAGGATVCPLPECVDGTAQCEEAQAEIARRRNENLASQTCVKSFLDQLGVSIEEQLAISNGFVLTTTAAIVVQLATHPHVTSIGLNTTSEGPG